MSVILDYRLQRETALEELEKLYRDRTMRACQTLYNLIYEISPNCTENSRKDFLENLLKHSDPNIRIALRDLDAQLFHPIFIAGRDGYFAAYNLTASSVFVDFDMSTTKKVAELYADGRIFQPENPSIATNYREVYRCATRTRSRVKASRPAWTKGHELVFFQMGRPKKRLVTPVTASLYVTTLHNRALADTIVGTIGFMSVPLYLRDAEPEEHRKTVFIAMPFEQIWSDKTYDNIRRAIFAAGLCPVRIDEQRTIAINIKIRDSIRNAQYVIADVTDGNPNVMNEVGYASGIGKEIILITQDVKNSPFNIVDSTQQEYSLDDLDALFVALFENLRSLPRTKS